MVERDAPGIALDALHQRSPSSEETYQQGVVHFVSFMDENGLDRNLLQHGKNVNHMIILSFIKYLRSRTVFDDKLVPPRNRPITAGYIDSCTTHVVKFVERSNADLASTLRSRDSAALISAYKHNDTIIRGPLDSYCPIPLGCEFVALALGDIDIMFCNDPASRALYRTVVLVEYSFGGRVYEILDRFHGGNPDLSPESARPYINHAVKARDLLLRWSCEGRWHPIYTVATFPDGPAQVAELLHDHTKNHPDGPTPVAVWRNPRGHDSPFCILHELTQFAVYWCHSMAPEQTLFAAADDKLLRRIFKAVAVRIGFNPNRTHLRGLRSGCCMSSTPDAFDDSAHMTDRVQQAYQGWAPNGQRPYARGLMGLGQIKSLGLYDLTLNTVNDTLARFMRHAQHDAIVVDP
jgi:hypothetical protein